MKNITFCVTSCGELTYDECWKSLEGLEDKVVFNEIKDVSPQIVALNRMLSECNTEYLVPIDIDFKLYPNAYERISGAIEEHKDNKNWHSILFPLWDTLTEQKILALKILRMSKICPFVESATPDIQHYTDLTNLGHTCIHEYLNEDPIGDHIVKGEFFCYHKYKDFYLTMRTHNKVWDKGSIKGGNNVSSCAIAHYNYFIKKYNETKNPDYKACICGIISGLKEPITNKSKDLTESMMEVDDVSQEFLNLILGGNKWN